MALWRRRLFEPFDLYQRAARQGLDSRNPVVVIPGVMGSRLSHPSTGHCYWGGQKAGFAKQELGEEARLICHPVVPGKGLWEVEPLLRPDGVLRTLELRFGGIKMCMSTYAPILKMLGVGGYLEPNQKLGKKDLDYGAQAIGTCFEFPYDWRVSLDQNAAHLSDFIDTVREFVAEERGDNQDVKVDIVTHSMGGLLLRYYLRYGGEILRPDGSAPPLTWAGAAVTDHAIFCGTPNAGSMNAIKVMLEGLKASPATPAFDAAVLGTLPAIYQLMPRVRHAPAVLSTTGDVFDGLYDPDAWVEYGWGLGSKNADERLRLLLPDESSPQARRKHGIEHLTKCLQRAKAFHKSIDSATDIQGDVSVYLFAGDRYPTPRQVMMTPNETRLKVTDYGPGDKVVLRSSALMDERECVDYPRLLSPLSWTGVTFLPGDHMGLTRDRAFVNSALWYLLEKPRGNGLEA